VVVNYAPGEKKNQIISGPTNFVDGFPMFAKTPFQYQIDSSFDAGDNVAFFFSRDQCVKTNYSPDSPSAKPRLLQAPTPIRVMFPCLEGTIFENGIDAILRAPNPICVYLFKGDQAGTLVFNSNTIVDIARICDYNTFIPFIGTVFEGGIDAAFNSHVGDEVFIFKGPYYAHYDVKKNQFLNGIIKRISDDWPALQSIL